MKTYTGYDIIELGSGDSSKISILMDVATQMEESAIHYLPLDISQKAIRSSVEELVTVYSNLYVEGYADDFDHLAFYNESSSRIEMYLVANCDLTVHSPYFNEDLLLKKSESIHIENSHKYSTGHIHEIVEATGIQLNHTHTDNRGWFAVTEFKKM